jgi:hypothetical protein
VTIVKANDLETIKLTTKDHIRSESLQNAQLITNFGSHFARTIKKFLPYPSEKMQRSKDAEKKRLFQTPSEILVHKGVCILNGWPSHDFGQNCDNRGKCK